MRLALLACVLVLAGCASPSADSPDGTELPSGLPESAPDDESAPSMPIASAEAGRHPFNGTVSFKDAIIVQNCPSHTYGGGTFVPMAITVDDPAVVHFDLTWVPTGPAMERLQFVVEVNNGESFDRANWLATPSGVSPLSFDVRDVPPGYDLTLHLQGPGCPGPPGPAPTSQSVQVAGWWSR